MLGTCHCIEDTSNITTLFPAQGIGYFKSFFAFLTMRVQWVKEIPLFPQAM